MPERHATSEMHDPARSDSAPAGAAWLAVWTLCHRELVRFARQRNRVVGAIGQPVLLWVLFGAGLGPTFRLPGAEGGEAVSYREYFFPGTLVLILLFTAIFTTISIIEDRREGFLQSVLVAPVPLWAMVLGKLLGGTLIALVQGLIFLALGLTLALEFSPLSLALLTLFCFVLAVGLVGLGFVIAWQLDSTQGFHALMSVLLMPMWLLSGAFFPASGWLGWVMVANPLTYGVAGVRRLLYFSNTGTVPIGPEVPHLATCWLVTVAFALIMFAVSCRISARRTAGDLV